MKHASAVLTKCAEFMNIGAGELGTAGGGALLGGLTGAVIGKANDEDVPENERTGRALRSAATGAATGLGATIGALAGAALGGNAGLALSGSHGDPDEMASKAMKGVGIGTGVGALAGGTLAYLLARRRDSAKTASTVRNIPVTTKTEKIAAFLKKIGEEVPTSDALIDKSLVPGKPNLPFAQNTGGEGVIGKATDFGKNVLSGLGRGHVGTVAGVGGAAILAGLLAYNAMKKKRPAYAE